MALKIDAAHRLVNSDKEERLDKTSSHDSNNIQDGAAFLAASKSFINFSSVSPNSPL
jgi:hypothetical protein